MILRAAVVTAAGAALIVLLAYLVLSAEPPAPRQVMRVSVELAHDALPVRITLKPRKEPPCADC